MKQLDTTLSAQARLLGAELYGVTDVENIIDHMHKIPSELLHQYQKAISIGIVIPNSIIANINNADYDLYNYFFTEVIIPTLNRTALIIANLLEKSDYRAFPLPANLSQFDKDHPYYFHNLIASYAGLGWLGKNNRLINSVYGARLQTITILTDAELENSEIVEDGCKQCTLCIDKCPTKALSGIPFHPHHEINDRCDATRCENKINNSNSQSIECGICLSVCPYNK